MVYIPELKSLYSVLNWHCNERSKEKKPGESVGVFVSLPHGLAEQFPSKDGEDSSPAHVTVCYIGDIPVHFEDKVEEVVKQVCRVFRPFKVKLGSPRKFVNEDNQTIIHSPVKSKKLKELNLVLRRALLLNLIPVSNKYPEYKPHVTIEYVNEGELPKYNIKPSGEWIVDHVWIWGGTEPRLITLGK